MTQLLHSLCAQSHCIWICPYIDLGKPTDIEKNRRVIINFVHYVFTKGIIFNSNTCAEPLYSSVNVYAFDFFFLYFMVLLYFISSSIYILYVNPF